MLFNSIHFLLFFPVVVFLYFIVPHRWRWILLLIASYYFYMSWRPEYVILIMLSTLVDYFAGLKMGEIEEKVKRKKYLYLSLFVNLGLLFLFKYYNFFSDSTRLALEAISINFNIPYFKLLLPVGISFYTFQTLSYSIDVYKGKIKPERHLGIFAVYVSFFPQLVAGPIERAKNLLPQFWEKHKFDSERLVDGLKIMLWGFFLKIVIADRLAMGVNEVYNNVLEYTGLPLLTASYFFAFQIYCDFAGYSFIAIGAAKALGFNLMDNFKRPYFSKSISEFWKRWHISLSTWFRDYVYIALGGNRTTRQKWFFNLFLVFLVSGLWHGAGWTFVIWGALHGSYLIISIVTKRTREKTSHIFLFDRFPGVHKVIKVLVTFHLVLLGWIFFRANSLSDAIYVITHMFEGLTKQGIESAFILSYDYFLLSVGLIFFMEFIHIIQERRGMRKFLNNKPIVLRWALYYAVIFLILLFGVFERQEFIYFQF